MPRAVPAAATLAAAVDQILTHVTPDTVDKEALNLLSRYQILHATWGAPEFWRDAAQANFLVPKKIYENTTNKVWRFPPFIRAEFTLETMNGSTPQLHAHCRFGVPRYVHYSEVMAKGVPHSYKTKPTLGLPLDFGNLALQLDGQLLEYKLASEDKARLNRFSAPPAMHQETCSFSLNDPHFSAQRAMSVHENFIILRKWSQHNNVINGLHPDGKLVDPPVTTHKGEKAGLIVLHTHDMQAKLEVSVSPLPEPNQWRVAVALHNTMDYELNKLEAWLWRPMSMILPHLYIQVENAHILLGPQQHADVVNQRLAEERAGLPEVERTSRREEWLDEYSHTNGVLARSILPDFSADTLLLCPFGIYDTVRLEPVTEGGLTWGALEQGAAALPAQMDLLTAAELKQLAAMPDELQVVYGVLCATMRAFGPGEKPLQTMRLYQWHAIQKRIQQLLAILRDDPAARKAVRVVRAPTGAGKTLVFMANAALHVALTGERSVLVFPTRVLNEDMFKRLTRLVKHLRDAVPAPNFKGGLLIGASDPLFRALASPEPNQPMIQYGACPQCQNDRVLAKLSQGRTIGLCEKCGHKVDYMYGPTETGSYLPNLVIATPDKLFHMATAAKFEQYNLRFFGAKAVPCDCGLHWPLDPKAGPTIVCQSKNGETGCGRTLDTSRTVSSPIGYFVFDEVHSLYGLSATLLSTFLDLLSVMGQLLGSKPLVPVYETGTATIANEQTLLTAITRRHSAQIEGFPADNEYSRYFQLNERRVRYRTLIMLPVATSSLMATCNGLLHQYLGFHEGNRPLSEALDVAKPGLSRSYKFALGYFYRKRDIFNIRHTLGDLYHQKVIKGSGIAGMDVLSGDSGPARVAKVMQAALDQQLNLLLANLVVSLGVDIEGLNNMVMFGLPSSMTEFVQTAGRTGRSQEPGHVTIFLNPSRPRDFYLYNYFYQMLGDISGYYESRPAQPVGIYAANIMAPNVVKAIIAADYLSKRKWLLSKRVAADFAQPARMDGLLTVCLHVLAGANRNDPVGREIQKRLRQDLAYWLMRWARDPGFLSDWFDQEAILLTSLRERASRTVALELTESLYTALGNDFATPDTLGSDDEANGTDLAAD